MSGGLITPTTPFTSSAWTVQSADTPPGLLWSSSLTVVYRHLEGTWQLPCSVRAGVKQIAGFGFNLFADEYSSPEAGGGGAQDGFLIIWGIVYKALGAEGGPEGDSDLIPVRPFSLSPVLPQ